MTCKLFFQDQLLILKMMLGCVRTFSFSDFNGHANGLFFEFELLKIPDIFKCKRLFSFLILLIMMFLMNLKDSLKMTCNKVPRISFCFWAHLLKRFCSANR